MCAGRRMSSSPLTEWHSFACVPSLDEQGTGGFLLISKAGDWTSNLISKPHPDYWIKGIPVTGVLCMSRMFRKVIIVASGAGIGPVLAVTGNLHTRGTKFRIIWSVSDPVRSVGHEICEMVKEADENIVVFDTSRHGRLNLERIVYDLYVMERAQAIFVLSNPTLTKELVFALECRGAPTFGPIWDS